ncbi:hypothetical protein K7432_008208 [Basidiobolus ranarum]|uniref:Arrestin C-terminal-like domain-containing protein n=1 Tax=Basidiobolus ranarum TaxID=34480 RepID=A0ABR2VZV2_9FUNG
MALMSESASGIQIRINLREDPIVLNGTPEESVGSVLCGVLVVTTTKRIKARSMCLLFQGTSRIRNAKEKCQSIVFFKYKWDFLEEVNPLHMLEADTVYEYPFELLLAGNLPVSVNVPNGEIKYQLKVVMERPSFLRNVIVTKPVQVERVSSILSEHIAYVACSGRWANSLRYDARVAKSHYQPGELLAFEMFVEINKAIFHLSEITLSIAQVVCYSNHSNYETKRLSHKSRKVPDYGSNEKLNYSMMIQIPTNAHPDCQTDTIELTHALMVKVKLIDKMRRKWWFYIDLPVIVNTPTQWELSASPPAYSTIPDTGSLTHPPPYEEKPV